MEGDFQRPLCWRNLPGIPDLEYPLRLAKGIVYSPAVPQAQLPRDFLERFNKLSENVPRLDERLKLIGSVATVVLPILVLVLGWGAKQIYEQRSELSEIRQSVKDMKDLLLPQRLKDAAAAGPGQLKSSLTEAVQIVQTAREKRVVIEPEVLAQVANKFIQTPAAEPETQQLSWKAIKELLDYRSFLNGEFFVSPPIPSAVQGTCIGIGPGSSVVVEDSVIANCRQALDGGTWKHVIFRNAVIIYEGRPTALEDVRFENCQFQIVRTPDGIKLIQALLSSTSTTVALSQPSRRRNPA